MTGRGAPDAAATSASAFSSWKTVYQLWSPSMRAASTGSSVGQHVEAEVAVEEVAPGEGLLVLGGVELGDGVDDVQLGLRPEALEHAGGGLATQGADLDHAAGADGIEDRGDRQIPEWKHARLSPSAQPVESGDEGNSARRAAPAAGSPGQRPG